jgi:hypothetical protein
MKKKKKSTVLVLAIGKPLMISLHGHKTLYV